MIRELIFHSFVAKKIDKPIGTPYGTAPKVTTFQGRGKLQSESIPTNSGRILVEEATTDELISFK